MSDLISALVGARKRRYFGIVQRMGAVPPQLPLAREVLIGSQ
jgi:hypothetical protein